MAGTGYVTVSEFAYGGIEMKPLYGKQPMEWQKAAKVLFAALTVIAAMIVCTSFISQ